MYLSDKELKKRLHEREPQKKLIISPSTEDDFNEINQVGVCSIDLKLSSKIWLERKKWYETSKTIDLGDTFYDNQIHYHFWKEKTLP